MGGWVPVGVNDQRQHDTRRWLQARGSHAARHSLHRPSGPPAPPPVMVGAQQCPPHGVRHGASLPRRSKQPRAVCRGSKERLAQLQSHALRMRLRSEPVNRQTAARCLPPSAQSVTMQCSDWRSTTFQPILLRCPPVAVYHRNGGLSAPLAAFRPLADCVDAMQRSWRLGKGVSALARSFSAAAAEPAQAVQQQEGVQTAISALRQRLAEGGRQGRAAGGAAAAGGSRHPATEPAPPSCSACRSRPG